MCCVSCPCVSVQLCGCSLSCVLFSFMLWVFRTWCLHTLWSNLGSVLASESGHPCFVHFWLHVVFFCLSAWQMMVCLPCVLISCYCVLWEHKGYKAHCGQEKYHKVWRKKNLNVSSGYITWAYVYIYMYAFSKRFYPKRLTVHSGFTFVLSVCVLPGNLTDNLCAANALL